MYALENYDWYQIWQAQSDELQIYLVETRMTAFWLEHDFPSEWFEQEEKSMFIENIPEINEIHTGNNTNPQY